MFFEGLLGPGVGVLLGGFLGGGGGLRGWGVFGCCCAAFGRGEEVLFCIFLVCFAIVEVEFRDVGGSCAFVHGLAVVRTSAGYIQLFYVFFVLLINGPREVDPICLLSRCIPRVSRCGCDGVCATGKDISGGFRFPPPLASRSRRHPHPNLPRALVPPTSTRPPLQHT